MVQLLSMDDNLTIKYIHKDIIKQLWKCETKN